MDFTGYRKSASIYPISIGMFDPSPRTLGHKEPAPRSSEDLY
jgi:hypothetical protein